MPDDAEKERAGTVHDCYVGKFPIAIVRNQRLDDEGEERVVRDGAHSIVGDAGGVGAANPSWVGEERVEAAVAPLKQKWKVSSGHCRGFEAEPRTERTYIVEVDIYTAIVREDKVSDGVCPLYRLGVIIEGGQEPRIFGGDELA